MNERADTLTETKGWLRLAALLLAGLALIATGCGDPTSTPEEATS